MLDTDVYYWCGLLDFRVYDTYEECMNPVDIEDLLPKSGNEAPAIDPRTYPVPPTAMTNCPNKRNVKTKDKSCPHMQNNLKLWEDPKTWGGNVPSPGTWVTIPAGTKVLITACSVKEWETYAGIVIPESSEVTILEHSVAYMN